MSEPNLYDLLVLLQGIMARRGGVALATSPVIPKIPEMFRYHEDPDTRANNFEARSLGQRERTDRPPARPKYTLAEGQKLAAQLRAQRQAQAAAAPPPPPKPLPDSPVQEPRLFELQRRGASNLNVPGVVVNSRRTKGPEMMKSPDELLAEGRELTERLPDAIRRVQAEGKLTNATDEQLCSALDEMGVFPEGWSWSEKLKVLRAVGEREGLIGTRGVEPVKPKVVVESFGFPGSLTPTAPAGELLRNSGAAGSRYGRPRTEGLSAAALSLVTGEAAMTEQHRQRLVAELTRGLR